MLRGHYDGLLVTLTAYTITLYDHERGGVTLQLTPQTTLAELDRHLRELAALLRGETK